MVVTKVSHQTDGLGSYHFLAHWEGGGAGGTGGSSENN